MSESPEEYPFLAKENFMPARWIRQSYDPYEISPHWRGYVAHLPELGDTTLYPLRQFNFGPIMPHIYSENMHHETDADYSTLNGVHMHVNRMFEPNGGYDHDWATSDFRSLIKALQGDWYRDKPELAKGLQEVFDKYKEMREEQRRKIATNLSHTISKHELFVVATDQSNHERVRNNSNLYAAQLDRIVNVRSDHDMTYKIVVSDSNGEQGFLPESFHVPAGVNAKASIPS